MKHKTQKRPKSKIVKNADYNCTYVSIIAVLIIFPVILQTVINLIMLSTGGQGMTVKWPRLLTASICHLQIHLWRYKSQNPDADLSWKPFKMKCSIFGSFAADTQIHTMECQLPADI